MAKKKSKDVMEKAVIDVKVSLPEDSKHLINGGHLLLYFDIDTRTMIRDIAAELLMSRNLPVEVDSIGIDDPLVLWLGTRRQAEFSEDGTDAILAARHIYRTRIEDCNREAIIIALTAYTEIVGQFDDGGKLIVPRPYEKDKAPLSGKKRSVFLASVQKREDDIPPVRRNLKNPYEARLKWVDDILSDVGLEFYINATRAINTAVMEILSDLEEKDKSGFQPETADRALVVSADADD